MVNVLIHHKVKDFSAWKAAFDSALMFRKDGGEASFRLYHDISDPNDITLWFEWESQRQAEEFVHSEELRTKMKLAGVEGEPHIHILHEIVSMRRTAAD